MHLHAKHSISSALCMYGSELLGGLQPPEPLLDPPLHHAPPEFVISGITLQKQPAPSLSAHTNISTSIVQRITRPFTRPQGNLVQTQAWQCCWKPLATSCHLDLPSPRGSPLLSPALLSITKLAQTNIAIMLTIISNSYILFCTSTMAIMYANM